ncbi:CGNR zinc finger domain-containing protein [Catenuloplanes indicus]|uniref:RNA-binding Zn ribbon-like protein n=1 Tax=Catenuloplanes indicus TaxID=137267 RepID=A0AAE3VUF9_9ACTN|nr:CGNR zinc finger domain-containing protein [Catenuloplanes indicus]MDQ0363926.1 putative RNA-binding Zn ribbon-like protein [Catenuloplanes indicus]
MLKHQEAPGRLELVRGFLNTLDLEHGTDRLAGPDDMHRWVRAALPQITAGRPTETGRLAAVRLREALRAAAAVHSAAAPDPAAHAALDEITARLPLRLHFDAALTPGLRPAPGHDDVLAGTLLGIVAEAALDGTWRRLKICPAEDCRWAFYDHAKNRMGVWCQMAECGNRAKARRHRGRQART